MYACTYLLWLNIFCQPSKHLVAVTSVNSAAMLISAVHKIHVLKCADIAVQCVTITTQACVVNTCHKLHMNNVWKTAKKSVSLRYVF